MFPFILIATADHDDEIVDTVDFADFENVADAFTALIRIFAKELDDANFETIRIACFARAEKKLQGVIRNNTSNVHTLCTLLVCHPLVFNWMYVEFFQTMAIASGNKKLQDALKDYNDIVLNKTLGEIWNFIPSHHTRTKYYSKVLAKVKKQNPYEITVNELKEYKPKLAKKIAMHIMQIDKGSLTIITWCILAEKTYQVYLLALSIPQECREDDFLQVGMWIVYHPQLVVQKLKRVHSE